MKHIVCILLAMMLCLVAAGAQAKILRGSLLNGPIAEYGREGELPAKAAYADGLWYMLLNGYGSSEYAISVSGDCREISPVYHVPEGSAVWFLEADGGYAAWCERGEGSYRYMLYDHESGDVEEFFSTGAAKPQNQGLAIHDGGVYFGNIDYAGRKAALLRYDISEARVEELFILPYAGERSIQALNITEGMLVAAVTGEDDCVEILTIDLDDGQVIRSLKLPENVEYVYAVAKDTVTDNYAIYYLDGKNFAENIGICRAGAQAVKSLFTFGSNVYAYRDAIEYANGHVCWVIQMNVSGRIIDHYRLVVYDAATDTPKEYARTFDFHLDGDNIYALSFDEAAAVNEIELHVRKM